MLSLLAWAATASAECAWVLWYGPEVGKSTTNWRTLSGHKEYAACESALQTELAHDRDRLEDIPVTLQAPEPSGG
jgi:hypothetical protein